MTCPRTLNTTGFSICVLVLAVLILAATFSRSERNPTGIPCRDVRALDFNNLTTRVPPSSIHRRERTFAFHDGIAWIYYRKVDVFRPADWKAEIQRDTVVQPAQGTFIRFLFIDDNHETGSEWHNWLLGYRCLEGKLKKVFRCAQVDGEFGMMFTTSFLGQTQIGRLVRIMIRVCPRNDVVNNPALVLALARTSEAPHRPVPAYSAVKLLRIPIYEIIASATS
jgi:hypothetical protein